MQHLINSWNNYFESARTDPLHPNFFSLTQSFIYYYENNRILHLQSLQSSRSQRHRGRSRGEGPRDEEPRGERLRDEKIEKLEVGSGKLGKRGEGILWISVLGFVGSLKLLVFFFFFCFFSFVAGRNWLLEVVFLAFFSWLELGGASNHFVRNFRKVFFILLHVCRCLITKVSLKLIDWKDFNPRMNEWIVKNE